MDSSVLAQSALTMLQDCSHRCDEARAASGFQRRACAGVGAIVGGRPLPSDTDLEFHSCGRGPRDSARSRHQSETVLKCSLVTERIISDPRGHSLLR
jgi:hypothetical protein